MTPAQQAEFDQLEAADNAPPPARMGKEQATEMSNRDAYREAFDESSGFDQFMAGVGKPVMQIFDTLGIGRNLNRPKTDAEKYENTAMMEEQHGLASGAGEVVGDIALMALPAGGIAKGASAVTKGAPNLVRAGTVLAGESALVGGVEGLKAPEAGETRTENALEAAKWSAILGAPFAGLRHVKAPVSDAAQELLDEGIPLTAGMASKKGKRAAVENFMSNIPLLGGKVSKMQDETIETWNRRLLQKTSPTGAEIRGAGHEGFQDIQKQFKEAYTDIWNSVKPEKFNMDKFGVTFKQAEEMIDALPANDTKTATRVLENMRKDIKNFKMNGQEGLIENFDDFLRTMASDSANAGNELSRQFYLTLRTSLRNAVGDDVTKKLMKTDGKYRDFKVLEKAASYVKPQEGGAIFSPRNLESAVKAKNQPSMTTKGKGAMQNQASEATSTIAKVLPERSQISSGADIGKWGTLFGIGATGGAAAIPLVGARGMLNEGMRKFLTGTPMDQLKLPANIERMMRLAGVSTIDQIQDPVFKQAVIKEVESEMANETTE